MNWVNLAASLIAAAGVLSSGARYGWAWVHRCKRCGALPDRHHRVPKMVGQDVFGVMQCGACQWTVRKVPD